MIKKLLAVLLTLCIILSTMLFSGCTKSPSWWTEDQQKTISSIRQIDDKGYLHEINYVADYKLDDIIKEGTYPTEKSFESIQKIILDKSQFSHPKNISIGGCSTFSTTASNNHQILGRNYDWYVGNSSSLVVHTAPKNGYKSISVTDPAYYGYKAGSELTQEVKEGLLYSPFAPLEGVNEKGFSAGLMILNNNPVKQSTGKQQLSSSLLIRLMLDKAATVDDAINLIKKYDVISGMLDQGNNFHWLIADNSGNRAVLEFVNNKLVVNKYPIIVDFDENTGSSKVEYPEKDTGYLLSTNFYVTKGAQDPGILDDNGYWRYETLANLLNKNPHPDLKEAMSYLDSIHYSLQDKDTAIELTNENKDPKDQKNWEWISIDSSIYDLNEKTLDICIQEDYSKQYHFDFEYKN